VRAQRIAEAGKKKGMVLQAGGFLESRLGFTATAHLVQADASIVHIDFDTPLMFEDDPVEGGITYGSGGRIDMPASAGSGASLKDGFAEGGITITG
jgi:L-alanine-DL-glutamate epimerase-like enolase superfamily enzyme